MLKQEYNFLNRFKLKAIVTKESKPILEISIRKKIKNGKYRTYRSRMDCIHVVTNKITIEEYNKFLEDKDLKKITNKEFKIKPLKLDIDQAFIAHKSWVQPIAENGLNSFILLDDLEKQVSDTIYPISSFLIHFVIRHDLDIALQLIDYIKSKSVYEGVKAQSFIDINFNILIKLILDTEELFDSEMIELFNKNKNIKLLTIEMFKLNPSINVFKEKGAEKILFFEELKYYKRINKLLEINSFKIILSLLKNPLIYKKYSNYVNKCFKIYNESILSTIAEYCVNPKKYPQFAELFNSKSYRIRSSLVLNKKSYLFPQFNNLITDINADIVEDIIEEKRYYKKKDLSVVFEDKREIVLESISKSELLAKYYPNKFNNFIQDMVECIRKTNFPKFEDRKFTKLSFYDGMLEYIIVSLLVNPETPKLPIYETFLNLIMTEKTELFYNFAKNEKGHLLPNHFSIAIERSSKKSYRELRRLTENPSITKAKNFNLILHHSDKYIKVRAISLLKEQNNFKEVIMDKIYWFRNKKRRWIQGIGGKDIGIGKKINKKGFIK
jgi:hypothetical protein